MRKLIIAPDEILRQKCKIVERITPSVRGLAEALEGFLKVEHDDLIAISISAPQLGESVRVFAFRANPHSVVPSTQVLINPVLIYGKKLRSMYEMCFSMPGKQFVLQRYEVVKVRGTTLGGNEISFKVRGVVAQSIQHELSHLDGVLIDELGEEVGDDV